MNNLFVRFVSRILIAGLVCLPLQAQADLIGANHAISAAQSQSARALVAGHLQAAGLVPEVARERVAALTDAEVLSLADRVGEVPAGAGIPGLTVGVILVVAFLIWRFGFSDQAQAETAKPGAKPAAKPAPEQKK